MQTIKMNNQEAFELLTLVQRTIARTEEAEQDAANTEYHKNLKAIEKSLYESCPVLVKKWDDLQGLIRAVNGPDDAKGHERFRQAVVEFDEWIDANE